MKTVNFLSLSVLLLALALLSLKSSTSEQRASLLPHSSYSIVYNEPEEEPFITIILEGIIIPNGVTSTALYSQYNAVLDQYAI